MLCLYILITIIMSQVLNSKPPLLHIWRAHDSAVVSIEYVQNSAGDFILTASSDRTARLWAADGKFVGTFGQVLLLNISCVEYFLASLFADKLLECEPV